MCKILSNQISHYTCYIMPKRITSLRGLPPHHLPLRTFRGNVAAVAKVGNSASDLNGSKFGLWLTASRDECVTPLPTHGRYCIVLFLPYIDIHVISNLIFIVETTAIMTTTIPPVQNSTVKPGDDSSFNWDHLGNMMVGLLVHDVILVFIIALVLILMRFVCGYEYSSKQPSKKPMFSEA